MNTYSILEAQQGIFLETRIEKDISVGSRSLNSRGPANLMLLYICIICSFHTQNTFSDTCIAGLSVDLLNYGIIQYTSS